MQKRWRNVAGDNLVSVIACKMDQLLKAKFGGGFWVQRWGWVDKISNAI
jgi:hypothetical protein